jgi:hypothetical protein
MCPNCLTSIAMAPSLCSGQALGGAGSAVLLSLCSRQALAAAGLRLRSVRAPETTESNPEETAS